jgi:hypothetical protein
MTDDSRMAQIRVTVPIDQKEVLRWVAKALAEGSVEGRSIVDLAYGRSVLIPQLDRSRPMERQIAAIKRTPPLSAS